MTALRQPQFLKVRQEQHHSEVPQHVLVTPQGENLEVLYAPIPISILDVLLDVYARELQHPRAHQVARDLEAFRQLVFARGGGYYMH